MSGDTGHGKTHPLGSASGTEDCNPRDRHGRPEPPCHSYQMDLQSVAKALEAFSAEVVASTTSKSVKSQKPEPPQTTASQGKKA